MMHKICILGSVKVSGFNEVPNDTKFVIEVRGTLNEEGVIVIEEYT